MSVIRQIQFGVLGWTAAVIALSFLDSSLRGDVTPVVLSGQPAPGTAGGRFDGVRPASINASGDMAFYAYLDFAGVPSSGIFHVVGGILSPVALEGQGIPDASGLYFGAGLDDPQMNNAGDIVFASNYAADGAGTNFGWGLFLYSSGALHKIADSGTSVPGMIGRTFKSFGSGRVNDNGDIAFIAGVGDNAGGSEGLFLYSRGSLNPIVFQNNFFSNRMSMNNRGEIAFETADGISEYSGGVVKSVVRIGQPVPNSNLVVRPSTPSINDDGDIVFTNSVLEAAGRGGALLPFSNAVLRWRQGVVDKIAATGDPVPGFDPNTTFRTSGFVDPKINEGGIVFYGQTSPSPGQNVTAVICRYENGQLSLIAREDQVVPGIGTLASLGTGSFDSRRGQLVAFITNPGPLVTPPLSEGLYLSAPVPYTLLFPHIADGTNAGGGWRTTLILANQSTTPASSIVSFYDDAGSPMTVLIGGQPQTQATVSIPSLGVAQLQTDGAGPLRTGWAKVQMDQIGSGIALFGFYDGAGQSVGEVGDSASVPLRSMSLFVQAASGISTGIALANPNATAASVTLILKDSNSTEFARTSFTVPAMGHLAKYTGEIFSGLPSGRFDGKMEVVSTLPLVAITLRQRGSGFTSLPVIP